MNQVELSEEQSSIVVRFLEKVRSHQGVSADDIRLLPHNNQTLFEELEDELSNRIKHVGKTYSGVKMVHFCKNTACENEIANYGLPRNFGSIVFWKFVEPMIIEAREKLGIQYIFRFAADMSYDKN